MTTGAKIKAPHGTWISPITVDQLVSDSVKPSDAIVDPITSTIYHIEGRPSEGGRSVLVQSKTGLSVIDSGTNPSTFDVRTSVHEYGGAAAIVYNDIAYFSNFGDGRVYRVRVPGSSDGLSEEPEPVTPLPPNSKPSNPTYRFANFDVHPLHPHLLVAIFEDHTIDLPSSVVSTLCVIDTKKKTITDLVKGVDFYATPTFSPGDGKYLAWQQWNHPDMPWQGGEIHAAEVVVDSGEGREVTLEVKDDRHVAGEKKRISAGYPLWINQTTLAFLNDVSGYLNPWVYDVTTNTSRPAFKHPVPLDFGALLWGLNSTPHALVGERWGTYTATKNGRNVLLVVDYFDDKREPVQVKVEGEGEGEVGKFVTMWYIRTVDREKGTFVLVAGQVDKELGVVIGKVDIDKLKEGNRGHEISGDGSAVKGTLETIYWSSRSKADSRDFKNPLDAYISYPIPKTLYVQPDNAPVHVVLYLPFNPKYEGTNTENEKPPCVVHVHGGPNGITTQTLDWSKQYWTSRGWAWLDVNYGGSSGYGRAYLERLDGNWGVVDVNDCIAAAKALGTSTEPLIDLKRTVIRGGSAGGYTTLCALSNSPSTSTTKANVDFEFATGNSFYGVTDVKLFLGITHKFELHYLLRLMGGTPEEVPDVYEDRSPLKRAEKGAFGKKPILVLQGEDDKVVPKEQADKLVAVIEDHQGQVEYEAYPGEGHGWRKAETITDSIKREIRFYSRVFGIQLIGDL
ncbi:alpha/beta-hydrolase [Pluteus cervinus]|uniref:Alpha/beta-hydrolase n=1 Tax=Pluteus cervinus TaxID=181527 RepID=A0ACD3ARQ2_9AGAR|nr:alpha/beta-hydrolase [Pluteus cervinus]